MDLFEAIKNRFSYRGVFEDRSVPRDHLKTIVQAGLDAPSGTNRQTTSFVIVDDAEKLAAIRACAPDRAYLESCRALICCVVDKDPELIYHGHQFQLEDCAAAVENMLLAITALGYASVWLDGMLRVEHRAETVAAILGLPSGKKVQILRN